MRNGVGGRCRQGLSSQLFRTRDVGRGRFGIIAGWGMIILGLSYYARRWIGHQRWKLIHRFTALAWALGLVHTFTEGTDAGQLWFVALILLTAAPAMLLLARRLGGSRSPLVPAAAQR